MAETDIDRLRQHLGGVQIGAMNGDNLAITLCTHFDAPDEEIEDETCWGPSALNGANATLDAIHAYYATALTDRDAQIERLKSELEDERAEVKRLSGDPPADWGEVATMLAEQVMLQLGRAPEASRDPGIDPRRDRICVLIESALNARAETAERELAEARAEVERLRSERSYIVGFNDGFEEAQAQQRAEMAKGETDAEA